MTGSTLLGWWGATGAVGSAASTYLWWSLAGLPATLIVMAGTGFVRGGGNTVGRVAPVRSYGRQILVARELGAGSPERARAVGKRILSMSALLGLVIGALLVPGRSLVAPIFSDDPAVIAVAAVEPSSALAVRADPLADLS